MNSRSSLLLSFWAWLCGCFCAGFGAGFWEAKASAAAPCRPFLFYSGLSLPAYQAPSLPDDDEASRLASIALLQGQDFVVAYSQWTETPTAKTAWLSCVYPYLIQDTDGDGEADWTGVVDRQPSKILLPLDADIDNDGLDNVLDPQPFIKSPQPQLGVPAHAQFGKAREAWEAELEGCGDEPALWQEKLYNDFGLLALEHSAPHAACVLEAVHLVLQQGVPSGFLRNLGNLKYLYAFAGHDSRDVLASYHMQMRAISIGGAPTYAGALNPRERVNLIAAVAHELGHAYILGALQPPEFFLLTAEFGGFRGGLVTSPASHPDAGSAGGGLGTLDSFYAPVFFEPHPLQANVSQAFHELADDRQSFSGASQVWQGQSITSHYALSNRHEWFAEAFAAHVLQRLGLRGALGQHWQHLLSQASLVTSDRWTSYANLAPALVSFLNKRLYGEP